MQSDKVMGDRSCIISNTTCLHKTMLKQHFYPIFFSNMILSEAKGKDRRCVYTNGDVEDLSLDDIASLQHCLMVEAHPISVSAEDFIR